jgi:TolA-binding protein
LRTFAREACAALLAAGCAGAGAVRPDADPVRAELRALRAENEALSARVDALSSRVELLTASASHPAEPQRAQGAQAGAEAAPPSEAPAGARPAPQAGQVVVPDLAVVKVHPEESPRTAVRPPSQRGTARPAAVRPAPPVPTAVLIREPDPARLDALTASGSGRRPLAAQAEAELRAARATAGLARAHALEDFTAHYPQHPAADNALVEAAEAYLAAGRDDAGCALARRVVDEYPAGDALPDALCQLAGCEGRRGDAGAEQQLLVRVRTDYPGTPAAQRAEERLTQISGPGGEVAPRGVSARSSP